MTGDSPSFWWGQPNWRAHLLWPAAAIYGAVAGYRLRHARREKVEAPVLCVGNFTVGGSGKTPVAIALAEAARRRGLTPGFLSRGYTGAAAAPRIVDPLHDTARLVGDEPLLLAAHAPVAVTPDRAAGARLLIRQGCDFLIMDDGFQSARIHLDHALLVVDARYGLGNGRTLPAGPVRAPLLDQIRFTDALLVMGAGDAAAPIVRMASRAGRPVMHAATRPRDAGRLKGRRVLAFAGIGHPRKFFDTIEQAGATVALEQSFPDHHAFTTEELDELETTATEADLDLVTTGKDAMRIGRERASTMAGGRLRILDIEVVFESESAADGIIEATLDAWRSRRMGA